MVEPAVCSFVFGFVRAEMHRLLGAPKRTKFAEKPVNFETRLTIVDFRERREGGMYRYVPVCARKGRGALEQWGSLVL